MPTIAEGSPWHWLNSAKSSVCGASSSAICSLAWQTSQPPNTQMPTRGCSAVMDSVDGSWVEGGRVGGRERLNRKGEHFGSWTVERYGEFHMILKSCRIRGYMEIH